MVAVPILSQATFAKEILMRFRSWLAFPKTRSLARHTAGTRPCQPARFRPHIEALEDRTVPSTFSVVTAADNGDDVSPVAGSLRAAILSANAHPNNIEFRDRITFAIPGAGAH